MQAFAFTYNLTMEVGVLAGLSGREAGGTMATGNEDEIIKLILVFVGLFRNIDFRWLKKELFVGELT